MTAPLDLYQVDTDRLAADTERAVLAIYQRWATGDIDRDTAALLIAAAINRANASATVLADVWLAAQIEHAASVPATTVGILAADNSERLLKAAGTVLAEPDTADTRLARLARAEPLDAGQQATTEAIKEQPMVQGWTRQMDADPCQLCRWWWREGRIWPKAHPFQRHKGCNCQPRIVLARNIKSTRYTRKHERTQP